MNPFRRHHRPFLSATLLSVVLASMCPIPVRAQEATVRVQENFRSSPNGPIVGTLVPGAPLEVESREGGWTQATVRGYVYVPSLQVWTEGEFDLVVSADAGENLRAEPAGSVLGRLDRGALLEEVSRIPGWIEVRRTGWIWTGSIEGEGEPAPVSAAPPPAASSPVGSPVVGPVVGGGDTLRSGAGAVLAAAPAGDTLATLSRGAPLEIVSRDGDWARVRLDGWVWLPGLSAPTPGPVADGSGAAAVSVAELVRDPRAYQGRLVEVELQFISLERAERIRTDFYEGEPFLLTRSPDAGRAFVYVAVPPERLGDVEGIAPLETVRVSGVVRAGAATLTGNPVLDLVAIAVVE